MRKLALAFLATLVASPVLAENCVYRSGFDLGTVTLSDGPLSGEATLTLSNGEQETCSLEYGDEAGNTMLCPSSGENGYTFALQSTPYNPNATWPDLLILWEHAWFLTCA